MSWLFPKTAQEVEIDEITIALTRVLPQETQEGLRSHAEALLAIARELGVPNAALEDWIGYRAPDKQWSRDEFRRWGTKFASDLRALQLQPAVAWEIARCAHCSEILETEAQAASHVCHMLCPICTAHSAQRINGRWLCANCGEVAP